MRRRIAWTGIALLAIYLVFIGGGWLGIYRSDLRVVTLFLAAGTLAAWAWLAWRDRHWHPRSHLAPALAACLGSLALSTLFSAQPRMGVEYLGYAVLLVAMYLLLVRLMAEPDLRDRLVVLGALLGGAIALELIGGVLYLWVAWWQTVGQVVRPPLRPSFIGLSYGNPSAVLTIVSLFAVPAAYLVATRLPRRRVPVLILLTAVVAVVALLSGSRAGWLALAIAFALVGLGWLAGADGRAAVRAVFGRVRAGGIPWPWRVAGIGLVGALGVAAIALLPSILERVGAGGEDLRLTFYLTALRLFARSPIVGTGPGTWTIEHTAVTQAGEIEYYVPHAHDVPVQTLAELGIVGAIAGVLLLGSIAWLVWSAIRSADSSRRWLGYLTALGLLYFGIHNLLDFYANLPAILFAAALPVAYLDATQPAGPRLTDRIRRTLDRGAWPGRAATASRWALAWACAIALAGLLVLEAPAGADERAVAAADAGDWSTAFQEASFAATQDPGIRAYAMTAGIAAAHLDEPEIAARYLRAVAEGDDLPEAWLDLAAMEARLGDTAAAVDAVHAALRLGVARTPIVMAAGGLLLQLGRLDEARQAFATAVAQRPSLAGDPWWQTPAVAAAVPSIAALAMPAAPPSSRWEIELMAGDLAAATNEAQGDSAPLLAKTVVLAWTGASFARTALFNTCRADPTDVGNLSWCARVAGHLGDTAAATQFGDLAETIQPGASESAYELRVAATEDTRQPTTQTAQFWGVYTYRRPTPQDLLVPGLIHLVLQ